MSKCTPDEVLNYFWRLNLASFNYIWGRKVKRDEKGNEITFEEKNKPELGGNMNGERRKERKEPDLQNSFDDCDLDGIPAQGE
jgi:hypothetical protein